MESVKRYHSGEMLRGTTIGLTLLWLPSVSLWSQESSLVTNLGLELAVTHRSCSAGVHLCGKWLAFTVNNQDGGCVLHVHDLEAGATTNLGFEGDVGTLSGHWLVFGVNEDGEDLNDDGDTEDRRVLHLHDLEAGETTSLWLAAGFDLVLSGKWLAFTVAEEGQGEDLNQDGDMNDFVVHVRDLEAAETTDLGLAGVVRALSGKWLAFNVFERGEGADLNGNGDMEDRVVHVHDLEAGATTNLGLAGDYSVLSGKWLAFNVFERGQAEDLNQDGDMDDEVVHVRDLDRAETTNLGLGGRMEALSSKWLAFEVWERGQGQDRDILHLHDLEAGETTNLAFNGRVYVGALSGNWLALTVSERDEGEDLNQDGDREDFFLHLRDLEAAETTNLGLMGFGHALSDKWLAFDVSESEQDLNGDGDIRDDVLHLLDLSAFSNLPRFLRGDCNADGLVEGSLADPLFYLEWAFSDGAEPQCLTACDADGDGFVGGSVADPLYYLNWAFFGRSAPPLPFPQCGKSLRAEDFPMRCDAPAECP